MGAMERDMSPDGLYELITDFRKRYGDDSLNLAFHVSVADRVRPEMVALIRTNFLEGPARLQPYHDADVLFGPLCVHQGGGIYEMHKAVKSFLFRILDRQFHIGGGGRQRSQEVARLLRHHLDDPASRTGPQSDHEGQFRQQNLWRLIAIDEPETALERIGDHARARNRVPRDLVSTAMRSGGIIAVAGEALAPYQEDLAYISAQDLVADGKAEEGMAIFEFLSRNGMGPSAPNLTPPDILLAKQRVFELQQNNTLANDGPDIGRATATTVSAPSSIRAKKVRFDLDKFELFETAITRAVRAGDKDQLYAALERGPDQIDRLDRFGMAPLHHAVRDGRPEFARILLEAGADPEVLTPYKNAPLFYAGNHGLTELAHDLIERGANPARTTIKQTTALMVACHFGQRDLVALLLAQEGVDEAHINSENDQNFSALLWAVGSGDETIVDDLIEKGAKLKEPSETSFGPLHFAACSQNPDLVQRFIQEGYPVNAHASGEWTPLMLASADNPSLEATRILIECGADPGLQESNGWTARRIAASWDNIDIFTYLTDHTGPLRSQHFADAAHNGAAKTMAYLLDKVDIQTQLKGWIDAIIQSDKPAGLDFLIDRQSEFDTTKDKLIFRAIELGAVENIHHIRQRKWSLPALPEKSKGWPWVVDESDTRDAAISALLQFQSDPIEQEHQSELLMEAAKDGLYLTLGTLLDNGADADPDEAGKSSPLAAAIKAEQYDTVLRLLEAGANPNRTRGVLNDPLIFEAKVKGLDILVAQGADPQITNDIGWSLLHHLAVAPNMAVFEWAMAQGLDVNRCDNHRVVPLHLAAQHGQIEVARLLIDNGATLELRRHDGLSPVLVALRYGHTDMVEMLLERGASPTARTPGGWCALHLAAEHSLVDEVKRFWPLLNSRDIAASDPPRTALQVAAETNAVECIKLLLSLGVPSDHRAGSTPEPLLLAVKNSAFASARTLLQAQAYAKGVDPRTGATLSRALADQKDRAQLVGEVPDDLEKFETDLAHALDRPPPAATPVSRPKAEPNTAPKPKTDATCDVFLAELPGESAEAKDTHWINLGGRWPGLLLRDLRELDAKIAQQSAGTAAGRGQYSTERIHQIVALDLPFYANARLVRLHSNKWQPPIKALFFLDFDNNRQWLNGQDDLLEVGNPAGPQIDKGNVISYLRFFCYFSRAQGNFLYPIENVDDPNLFDLLRNYPDLAQTAVEPAKVISQIKGGAFLCSVNVLWGHDLAKVRFRIGQDGKCELTSRTFLKKDLSVSLDLPLA